jgi:hypothetical protein
MRLVKRSAVRAEAAIFLAGMCISKSKMKSNAPQETGYLLDGKRSLQEGRLRGYAGDEWISTGFQITIAE